MGESEKYEGFGWIKVKREAPTLIEGKKFVSEEHHIAETNFLVQKVRELAQQLDSASAVNCSLRKQIDSIQVQESRRARYEADYLPWQEDERE
jgi:hypothetical protein